MMAAMKISNLRKDSCNKDVAVKTTKTSSNITQWPSLKRALRRVVAWAYRRAQTLHGNRTPPQPQPSSKCKTIINQAMHLNRSSLYCLSRMSPLKTLALSFRLRINNSRTRTRIWRLFSRSSCREDSLSSLKHSNRRRRFRGHSHHRQQCGSVNTRTFSRHLFNCRRQVHHTGIIIIIPRTHEPAKLI